SDLTPAGVAAGLVARRPYRFALGAVAGGGGCRRLCSAGRLYLADAARPGHDAGAVCRARLALALAPVRLPVAGADGGAAGRPAGGAWRRVLVVVPGGGVIGTGDDSRRARPVAGAGAVVAGHRCCRGLAVRRLQPAVGAGQPGAGAVV